MPRFTAGDRVRTTTVDPPHHTRLPRYARGAVGIVLEEQGEYPLADDRARGLEAPPQPTYAVQFSARELFGTGEHTVTLSLWQNYLEPV